jgi:hypothetical protein
VKGVAVPEGVENKETVPPTHAGLLFDAANAIVFTCTTVVLVATQPDPDVLIVTLYAPAMSVVMPTIDGFGSVDV